MPKYDEDTLPLETCSYPREMKLGARIQASSAHGIELFEDLLWDLGTLSFVPHVFQPTLTFFPGSGGEGWNGYGDKDGGEGGTRNFTDTSHGEASICAQLVSAVASLSKYHFQRDCLSDILVNPCFMFMFGVRQGIIFL